MDIGQVLNYQFVFMDRDGRGQWKRKKKKNEADMQPSSANTAWFGHSTSYHDMTKKGNKSC